jgi:amidase
MQFDNLDAVGIADMVRSGAAPAGFAVEAAFKCLSARNPAINAVIDRFDEHARAALASAPSGLLAGVPFLLKDTVEYPGFRHTDGSRWFAHRIGRQLPPWVAAMAAQGAVFIGKTNTPEFGLMDTTEPVLHGPTRNPWNTAMSAGGSSGGSAAAVAAGIAPIAHGTDGGGSIRYPAACCGLFGFKPSRDLAPTPYGGFDPRLPGGAVRHVLTRSVRDSALALAIAQAALAADPGSESDRWVREPLVQRLKIGFIETPTHGGPLATAHREAVRDAATLLRALGHTVVDADWPFDGPRHHRAFFERWAYGAYRYTQAMDDAQRGTFLDTIEPFTRGLIHQGGGFSADHVEALVQDAVTMKAAMDDFHRDYDVLLTPISAVHPLRCGHHDPRLDYRTVLDRVSHNVAFTFVQNATGQPAMSVPLYWTDDGLPVGIQLASGSDRDELLLRLAYELEQARPWFHRRPPATAAANGDTP